MVVFFLILMVKLSTLNADAGLRDDLMSIIISHKRGIQLTQAEYRHMITLINLHTSGDPHANDDQLFYSTPQIIQYAIRARANRLRDLDLTPHFTNLEASYKAAYQRFFWTFQQYGIAHPGLNPLHGIPNWQTLFKIRIEYHQDIFKYPIWMFLIAIDQLWIDGGMTQGQGFNHAAQEVVDLISRFNPPNDAYSAIYNNALIPMFHSATLHL